MTGACYVKLSRKPSQKCKVIIALVALLCLLDPCPVLALEITGEHRLMATYDLDPELRAAEALVIRWGDGWAELVVTKRWSPAWSARLEAELSFWTTDGGWDYGAGVLWKVTEGRTQPWVMVARPW